MALWLMMKCLWIKVPGFCSNANNAPGTSLDTMREKVGVRTPVWVLGQPLLRRLRKYARMRPLLLPAWQTEKKEPYPTSPVIAQYYIDHEWFLEAGEEFPTHKDAPPMGGDHPS